LVNTIVEPAPAVKAPLKIRINLASGLFCASRVKAPAIEPAAVILYTPGVIVSPLP
jgi:hypothetical protein